MISVVEGIASLSIDAKAAEGAEKDEGGDTEVIKELLDVHDKFSDMVENCFDNNIVFHQELKEAFGDIVNNYGSVKNSSTKHIEIVDSLALFCDKILKTGGEKVTDEEVNKYLEKSVQMFSYLNDKDIFNEIYRNQLAKRLLNQRSASDEHERMMIGKLKLKCGAQFTSKLEGMLNDLSVGSENSKNFSKYLADNKSNLNLYNIDFTVQILTGGHWPTFRTIDVILPPALAACTRVYRQFYDREATGRRLTWAYSLGQATVKGLFSGKGYDLQVTTVQAVVMVAFNSKASYSFSELMQVTNFSEDVLKRVLHSLSCCKYKVIKRVSEGEGEEVKSKVVKSTDSFAFNDKFTCPQRKIRIPMASLDEDKNDKKIDAERDYLIEAAVVRIMKSKKHLSHTQLTGEVMTQLTSFKSDPKQIKKRIESLIEREYLERDSNNPGMYNYKA
jgi:cullin 1